MDECSWFEFAKEILKDTEGKSITSNIGRIPPKGLST
jgi:dTDP-4-dehydrorhamnose reductase